MGDLQKYMRTLLNEVRVDDYLSPLSQHERSVLESTQY